MKRLLSFVRWPLVFVMFSTLSSACSGPQAYDVVVSLDRASFQGAFRPIEVDIVPVTKRELEYWSSFPVSSYFEPGTTEWQMRSQYHSKDDLTRFRFSEESPGPHTLSENDPLWQKRLEAGARNLVVIANLPVDWKDRPDLDPRRETLPLDSSRWKSDTIEIQLTKLRMIFLTPPLEED